MGEQTGERNFDCVGDALQLIQFIGGKPRQLRCGALMRTNGFGFCSGIDAAPQQPHNLLRVRLAEQIPFLVRGAAKFFQGAANGPTPTQISCP